MKETKKAKLAEALRQNLLRRKKSMIEEQKINEPKVVLTTDEVKKDR